MTVNYLDLVDYIEIAAAVTGLDTATVIWAADLGLIDSALRSPAAAFADTEFYPDFIDKAAVLLVHLARNHPLPDGNKRAAWVALRLFIEINDWVWIKLPEIDAAESAVLAVASGEWRYDAAADWLRQFLAATSRG